MENIRISKPQAEELVKISKDALPNESCALLLGRVSDDGASVAEILPMKNSDNSRLTFSINPSELLAAYSSAEQKGLDVAAIFHSHPAHPYPSSTDKKFMEINPVIWVIYSTIDYQMKAFTMARGCVEEVEIKTDARA